MAVTVQQFKNKFPEFEATSNALVEMRIAMAERRVSLTSFGDNRDDAVALKTASLLSMSPSGEQARLRVENRGNMYESELHMLARAAVIGLGRNS